MNLRTARAAGLVGLGLVVGWLGATARPPSGARATAAPARQFITNEEFINGLYAGLDLKKHF